MKHLLTTVAVILTTVILTLNVAATMRPFPAATLRAAQAPAHVAAFADAQCRRDPAGMVANSIGLSLAEATQIVQAFPPCSGARYLGSVHLPEGASYIFVDTYADTSEMWWIYSANDDVVTGAQ